MKEETNDNFILLDLLLIGILCFAIPLTFYIVTVGSGLIAVLIFSAFLTILSVLVFAAVKAGRKKQRAELERNRDDNSYKQMTSTEDLWSEDQYLPEQIAVNQSCSAPVSLTVTPVQPVDSPLLDESWDFDYEEEKRNRRIVLSGQMRSEIPFEGRYRSLQVLNDLEQTPVRKTSEPWEVYSRYQNYKLISSSGDDNDKKKESRLKKASSGRKKRNRLYRSRKLTRPILKTNFSTTSSTDADFIQKESNRKRKRKRSEKVSDAKFEQILMSLRTIAADLDVNR